MATERDFELLDDYLSNKLSPEEKALFEQKLNADSELSNEMNVQQELIKGIQNARIAELKAMLNNVPVTPLPNPGTTSVLVKLAVGTAVVGVIATGIWYFNNKEKAAPAVSTIETPVVTKDSNVVGEKTEVTPTVTPDAENKEIETKQKAESGITKQEKTIKGSDVQSSTPDINVYDPTTEDSEGTKDHVNQAESEPSELGKAEPSMAVSVDRTSKDYSFHYQYKEGKLFLYGPFETNLYEIMEFFNNNKRTVFLRHKANYYLLKEVDDKIRPLAPITDPALINKLEESRKQN
jgi:hypothetical protein